MSNDQHSSREDEFYRRLRKTVKVWAGGDKARANRYANLILAGPDLFVLLTRLARDSRVPQEDRARIAGTIAYFINPLDLVPELLLGPPGLVDDIALTALVLHDLLEHTDPSIIREHWEGDVDVLELVRSILAVADTMLGGPIWRRLRAMAQSFGSSA
ncbi:MAG: YkvA family protein [Anaerolineae bacterium]|jgi:uncharacterized membrane protein YkvA (DUF1232 family)